MSVTAGQPIKLADMVALAAVANAKAQLPQDVVPMFFSSDGVTKLGYNTCVLISLGGAGVLYTVGDVVTWGNGTSARIGSVDGTGKPTSFVTLNAGAWSPIGSPPSGNATGGTGSGLFINFSVATIGPTAPYAFADGTKNWLTELNRMRGNLAQLSLPAIANSISDRWPGSNGTDHEFFFADNGTPQNCQLVCSWSGTTDDPDQLDGNFSLEDPPQTCTCQVIIGGNQPVNFIGSWYIPVEGNPLNPVPGTFTITTDFPGAVFGANNFTGVINVMLNPGTYNFHATSTNAVYFPDPQFSAYPGVNGGANKISLVISTPTAAIGIHNSLPISKLVIPPTPAGVGQFPFGLWGFSGTNKFGLKFLGQGQTLIEGLTFPAGALDPSPTAPNNITFWQSARASVVPSTTGFFTSKQPMIASLNTPSPAQMPWNLQRHSANGAIVSNPMLEGDQNGNTSISGSYDNSQPVESQSEPPVWKGSTFFPGGFVIEDSNGNIQTAIAGGMSIAKGASGINGVYGPPQWGTAFGAQTPEAHPDVPFASTLIWQCTKVIAPKNQFAPAVHRPVCVPKYPVYWASETIANLKPPGGAKTIWGAPNQWARNNYVSGGQSQHDTGWQADNLAGGWWIYSVTLNRIGTNQKGNVLLPTIDGAGNVQQIPVTIGCMRNGVFTAFGTYQTGSTVQVLWPIFTSDALVYQATERVDVQAVAIAANAAGGGGGSVSQGAVAAGYPICAAFINDTEALLNLIN